MLLIFMHHLLQSFVLPPLNAFIIGLIGYITSQRYKNLGKCIIIFSLIFLYLQSTPIVAYYLNKSLELPPITQEQLQKSQAIIVLGGGVSGNGFEYPIAKATANTSTLIRLNYAAYLARMYPNKPLIVSGGYAGIRNTEAKVMKRILLNSYSINNNKIFIEDHSRNTDENAKYVAQMLKSMHIKTVAVVTQAYHVRRAVMLFKKYNINAYPASTDYYYSENAKTPILAITPSASAINYTARALHEIFGYIAYAW